MRYTILIIAFSLVTNLTSCQNFDYSSDWIKQLENPGDESLKLKASNLLNKYASHDYATLIKPKTQFLGYIGNDYRRIYMNFISVERVSNTQNYSVVGSTVVANNKCDFTGTITIKQIREFEKLHFGVDEEYRDSGIITQGLIIGDYLLNENKDQPHSGVFSGKMSLMWFIDKTGKLRYDDIESYSDSYKNNQYVGVWRDYLTKNAKTCNWGEYRVPFSGDLDIGAGEFSPNEKYYDKGWQPKN